MRKIIFRGFSKAENKWLYGDPSQCLYPPIESVGLKTGLKDREEREIYEGDILNFERMPGKKAHGYVAYCDEKARYVVRFQREKYERELSFVCEFGKPVIIGNTYENPELLEQERPNA
ncbi:MAG: YopX family protein [Pyramidobacter porci]|uniref:YopX family protein n=1 Tax=Pyramidobacter porci TaxID=2605789 RepID=UPI002A74A1C0|nr:YopX family protein [Pyramidobacter porci]MDY2648757.1 YopX family protein [Pyramidobacter porci]